MTLFYSIFLQSANQSQDASEYDPNAARNAVEKFVNPGLFRHHDYATSKDDDTNDDLDDPKNHDGFMTT